MSDPVLIVIIITVAVLIVLFMFRNQLSHFLFKANKDGVEAELKTKEGTNVTGPSGTSAEQPGVSIRRNKLIGRKNAIEATGTGTTIEENALLGVDQTIVTDTTKPASKTKQ